VRSLPGEIPLWASAAVVGGVLGTELGTRRLAAPFFRLALAAVLVIAGFKVLLT
jgi:uncharacterized membrane protein YfcA